MTDERRERSACECASCGGATVEVAYLSYEDKGWMHSHYECTNPKCLNPNAVCDDDCYHRCGCGDEWRERTEWMKPRLRNGYIRCRGCRKWRLPDDHQQHGDGAVCDECGAVDLSGLNRDND